MKKKKKLAMRLRCAENRKCSKSNEANINSIWFDLCDFHPQFVGTFHANCL